MKSLPAPNPNPTHLIVELAGPADTVEIRIYSSNFRLLETLSSGPYASGWQSISLENIVSKYGRGFYFYKVTATVNGFVAPLSKTGILYLTR